MAQNLNPQARISHLPRADGSATFSRGGYCVVSSVNGPMEVQRRDENPFESVVDVVVRPAAGVGGTGERQLENILQSALRQLIPVKNFPRCLIQITLQVTETPQNDYANSKVVQAQSSLTLLPALFHSAVLSLLSAAVPLKAIATCTTLAILEDGSKIIADPSPLEADHAKSLHVLSFTSQDDLLLAESEGAFTIAEWDKVVSTGQKVCGQHREAELGSGMHEEGQDWNDMRQFIRTVMEARAA
ncbi:exosome complex subunit Rrp46 [Colletotrichum graminicola]|uniref:Exosome complex subunit Rrp46 n=1 Tax=Colletotrichum graminicola (strain M1.001 / M2 / FGSC 10212) TaxID=645133 RepID=E3QEC2_COLGM|nr:exosome complex subunit Rrp46 [Colletotrichum graminicola M1.001]EFQ29228.1 exosome complex subunit Rrp46 [Colletotrichum graminicola M1.001]WDK13624.1 exosome complex subunit Rrp46 [Colletotrichum graminicola]